MKHAALLSAITASTLALASLMLPERRLVIWNVTPSVPTGLYRLVDAAQVRVGDVVAINPPPAMREWLSERGYLPSGMPLLKRIAAAQGQQVCRFRHGITIDGRLVALARTRDRLGRPLPVWAGCRRLGAHEFFALNPARADSLDGRYFGLLPRTAIQGQAIPIWTQSSRSLAIQDHPLELQ